MKTEIISGGILVLLGFFFAVGWDLWKEARETSDRDEAYIRVITADLSTNHAHIDFALNLLNTELEALGAHKSVVQPLPILNETFWDVIKINPPKDLIKSGKLEKLTKIMGITRIVNEEVRSRENYRLTNGAMSNFFERMKAYDDLLIEQLGILNQQIGEYDK